MADTDYVLISRRKGLDVYVTAASYDCSALPVLTVAGTVYTGVKGYDAISAAGQYAFNEDGRIYIAVPAEAAPGCSGQEVSDYMRKNQGTLTLLR